jgi:Protein of unknown function (DUF4013)
MLNYNEAFTFPFRDSRWVEKLLMGVLFTFLSIFILPIPVLYGYLIELLQKTSNNEPNPLPEWKDPGIKFLTGLKYFVVLFVYYIPLILVIILIISAGFLVILTGDKADIPLRSATLIAFLVSFVLPYSLLLYCATPLVATEFANKERISDGFRLGRILKNFSIHWKDVLLTGIVAFALKIASSIGLILFIIGVLFTSFYASLIIFHLYGQISRNINSSEK